ncbi:DDHD domain-containing protein [Gongronella butleri]|nr:DDHD domain-containing protein [Gongronella butleri]
MFFESTYLPTAEYTENEDEAVDVNDQEDGLKQGGIDDATKLPKDEKQQARPINHLVFIIHGIGQQTEQYGQFYEHVENLQETARQVLTSKLPDRDVRMELIPIEWHRHIHNHVDPTLERITLKSIPTIRMIENEYLADVLLYFSKDRGQTIVDNVTESFNKAYRNFMDNHPDFDGDIVILGYSLGGVITYDLLSHQRPISTDDEKAHYARLDVKFSSLTFTPDYFFALGSPIGAVLTFRNQSPVHYHPDSSINFENVYHPFDPLAYRMEPLYDDFYTNEPAVAIDRIAPPASFSFPSLPSFAGSSIFSYFSWKTQSQPTLGSDDGASMASTGESMATKKDDGDSASFLAASKAMAPRSPLISPVESALEQDMANLQMDDAKERGTGTSTFVDSLLGYFSSGTGNNQESNAKRANLDATTIREDAPWDPFLDPARSAPTAEPNSAARPNASQEMGTAPSPVVIDSKDTPGRPKLRRANTYHHGDPIPMCLYTFGNDCPSNNSTSNSFIQFPPQKSSSAKTPPSSGSLPSQLHDHASGVKKHPHPRHYHGASGMRRPRAHRQYPSGHHLVEILGIDGVRMESFERARTNFKRSKEAPSQKAIKKLPGNRRMDHALQHDGLLSMITNEYLVGLRAHFSYWTSKDLLWHIIRHLENVDKATSTPRTRTRTPSPSASSTTPTTAPPPAMDAFTTDSPPITALNAHSTASPAPSA